MGSKLCFWLGFWGRLAQKDSAESATYAEFFCTSVFWRFFRGPDSGFSGSDLGFWPIRILTQEKKSDPDPEKTWSETLHTVLYLRQQKILLIQKNLKFRIFLFLSVQRTSGEVDFLIVIWIFRNNDFFHFSLIFSERSRLTLLAGE